MASRRPKQYPREGSKNDDDSQGKQQSGQTAQLPEQLKASELFAVVLADRSGRVFEVLTTGDTLAAAIAFAVGYSSGSQASAVVIPHSVRKP